MIEYIINRDKNFEKICFVKMSETLDWAVNCTLQRNVVVNPTKIDVRNNNVKYLN